MLLYIVELFLGILLRLSLLKRGASRNMKRHFIIFYYLYFVPFVSTSIPAGSFPGLSGYHTWLFLLKLCRTTTTIPSVVVGAYLSYKKEINILKLKTACLSYFNQISSLPGFITSLYSLHGQKYLSPCILQQLIQTQSQLITVIRTMLASAS